MLAWTEAPYWEGLSYPSGGALCRPLWQDKYISAMWSDMWKPRVHYSWGTGGMGWSEMASCKKPAFIPHYQTPLSINLSKFSFTTNYRSGGFVINFPGWKKGMKPGIFLFLGEFNQGLFLLDFVMSIKSF